MEIFQEMEMDMDMNTEIWSWLPEDLLILILAKLPTLVIARFRAVCKQWKSLLSPSQGFQKITWNVGPCCTPAFLIGRLHPSTWIDSFNNNLYLLPSLPSSSHMYRLSLDFLTPDFINVVTACRSLLCCSKEGAPTLFYICNPVIGTWKKLPPTTRLRLWDFIGMAFEPSTRCCILVIGKSRENNMVVEIYESESNAWTKFEMDTPICPEGEGVYSRGRFYWVNSTYRGLKSCRSDVAVLDVRERRWGVVERPDGPYDDNLCYWQLTGYDGKVVLVNGKDLCLWKLDEDDGEEKKRWRWSELQGWPRRSICGGIVDDFGRERSGQVVVNSSGWVLVHLPRDKMVVFDAEGRMMQSIEGRQMIMFSQAYPTSVRALEINNVWWPPQSELRLPPCF